MSRVHIEFRKQDDQPDPNRVDYLVESPDFSSTGRPQVIARVSLHLDSKSYTFQSCGELAKHDVVPPQLYELPDEQRDTELRERYSGYGYGGWTSRIAKIARRLLDGNELPENVRGAT